MKLIVSFCAALLLLANSALATSVTSSCESSLNVAGDMSTGRDALSEICYTQHQAAANSDYTFLKWTGYWLDNTNKYMQPVTSWSAALNSDVDTTSSESGWRLPTIKELMLLADYSTVFDDSDASKVFANNWMVQQWLLRSSAMGSDLIAHGDAYLLSSTYVNDGSNKFMAMHINTGEVKAIDFSNMPAGDSYYVVKVKEEEPAWEVWQNKRYANCLSSSSAVGTTLTTEDCTLGGAASGDITNTSTSIKWRYETNTGFLRSYSNKCAAADTISNYANAKINNCPTVSAGVDKYRWNQSLLMTGSLGAMYSFSNQSNTSYNLYDNNNDVEIYEHGTVTPGKDAYGNDVGVGTDEDAVWLLKSN